MGVLKNLDAQQNSSARTASAAEDSSRAKDSDAQLDVLYARLGKLLFDKTKGIEEYYLLAPELYLAIERATSK